MFTLTANTPQRWWCPLCGMRYVSPLPLQHPPNHNCIQPDPTKPMRNRKMELEP